MFDFSSLKPLILDEELKNHFETEQVDFFYQKFIDDFLTSPFQVDGKQIKIISQNSRIKEYSHLSETFAHLITRDVAGDRIYECDRANRVHWIKPILLNSNQDDVLYYKWRDERGVCKEHFWLYSHSFMVVLKEINPNYQIVTSFCVDASEKLRYYERFTDYREGTGGC